jgi:3-dehydroquinate dehydratase/shikimate dehydrogenase
LVTLARTPEEAWPLVQILAKTSVPTVVVGLGKPGIMLSLLGKKIGAPWIYAALERGMEAYPGQATAGDLNAVYRADSIDKGTRFVGVTGFGESELYTVAALNAALIHHQLPYRCLPMGVGDVKLFRKVMEAVKLGAAVIDAPHQGAMMEMGPELHGAAKQARAVDLLINKNDVWHGFHAGGQAWALELRETMKAKTGVDDALKDRIVMVVGLSARAGIVAAEVQRLGGHAVLAGHERNLGKQLAQALGCRFVAFEALYTTMHDVVIVCDDDRDEGPGRSSAPAIHAGYLKDSMTLMDLTAGLRMSHFLREAKLRGCSTVDPRRLFIRQLEQQACLLTGKSVPSEILTAALPEPVDADA